MAVRQRHREELARQTAVNAPPSALRRVLASAAILVVLLLVFAVWILLLRHDPQPESSGHNKGKHATAKSQVAVETEVEFPLLGKIKGRRISTVLRNPDRPTEYFFEPETCVVDEAGNFLYLRNVAPRWKTVRSFEEMRQLLIADFNNTKENSSSPDYPKNWEPNSFRIIGPSHLPLQHPEVQRLLVQMAHNDEADIEIWGVRILHPIWGEREGVLTTSTTGLSGSSKRVKEWAKRYYEFKVPEHLKVPEVALGEFMLEMRDHWVEVPPDAISIDD